MMEQEREEVEQERAGLHKRIMDLYDALDRANARTERVFAMKADPPIFMPANALGKMTPAPDWHIVAVDESHKMERSLIATSANIYLKDFLRSWWKRHLRRWHKL